MQLRFMNLEIFLRKYAETQKNSPCLLCRTTILLKVVINVLTSILSVIERICKTSKCRHPTSCERDSLPKLVSAKFLFLKSRWSIKFIFNVNNLISTIIHLLKQINFHSSHFGTNCFENDIFIEFFNTSTTCQKKFKVF